MTLKHEGIPAGMMRELSTIGWSDPLDKLAGSIVPSDRTRIIAERGKQEVIVTRTFVEPRSLVFKAYTDPNLIPQWWGPKRFTTVIDEMAVMPGGLWRFSQRDSSGAYAFHGAYHEITLERIINTFEFEGMPGHVSLETCALKEQDGKTKLTTKSVFQSVRDCDDMLKSGMEEGVLETMDRLSELLGRLKIERKAVCKWRWSSPAEAGGSLGVTRYPAEKAYPSRVRSEAVVPCAETQRRNGPDSGTGLLVAN